MAISLLSRLQPGLQRVTAWAQRFPGVIALAGFVSGVASYFMVERHAGFARGIAMVVLLSWLWLLIEPAVRRVLERRHGWRIPDVVLRFLTQMVHQESLFFVLPFALVATTWSSGQAVFTGALLVAAAVAVIDPWYHGWLGRRRWLYLAYHTFTLSAVLLTALPLILHVSTGTSYVWALGAAVLLSYPTLHGILPPGARWRRSAAALLMVAALAIGWVAKAWVPPATLWLTEGVVSHRVDESRREPGDPLHQVTLDALQREGLSVFTAVHAPLGLHERIHHVWRHNGREVDRITLDIQGGRDEGYRAWSHKDHFPDDPTGRWVVHVITDNAQMIGRMSFEVTVANAETPSASGQPEAADHGRASAERSSP